VTRAGVDPAELADRLHSGAIRLLRRLRRADAEAGLSGPQASALSVLVFGGPASLKALAAAEQVQPPTMSRLVSDLERLGLVTRTRSEADARGVVIAATEEGRRLLQQARDRRLSALTASLERLNADDQAILARASVLLERIGTEGG
jgi:DNA-binding MarR family transcriptional regulator